MLIEPDDATGVAATLARASRERLSVEVRGGSSKRDWGVLSAPTDITLSTLKLNAVMAHRHGDLTATVQAGARLADVNRALARHGQWIPLDPPWPDRATIGGIVATNDSGPRRHRYGAPRDLIIGVDFVRADGVAAKAGGIVVKNVAGYDVARLLTGSFGSLAIIVSATFKLYPLAQASRTVVVELPSPEAVGPLAAALQGSQLTPTAIELQVPPARMLVRFETIDVATNEQAAAVVGLAENAGGHASIVQGEAEAAIWDEHGRRPWNGNGAVAKITLLPTDVAPTLTWIADASRGVESDLIGRAGVGVLLLRIGGDAATQARIINGLRARIRPGRGSAVLVRGSDELKTILDAWGPMGDGFALMRAVKQTFDPIGILNPGRGPGGL